jgi:outer membrane protein TolC
MTGYNALLAQALQQRAEVKALETRLRVTSLERQAAGRERLPRVTAIADYGLLGAGPDRSIGTYQVGASVAIPLWTSKRIESEIAAAAIRRQQAEARLADLRLDIAQELRRAHIESAASRRALIAAGRSVRAARETLDLVRLRQGAGLATSLDVIVAQGALAQAEDQEIRTRYQLQLAHARLARARGDIYSFLQ